MYTYKLGGMLITDELYHDDLEAMTFGRKDQNELMHYGIKGQSWGKRRFQNEDGSLTMAGRNRYDVGDPLQGSTNRAMAANRTYATGGGTGGFGGASGGGGNSGRFGGASGGGGSLMRKSAPTIQWSTTGKPPFSSEGPGQFAGRTVTNKVKAKVNDTVNSGRKAADSLFGSIGNAIKPVTDAVGKATEFVTGANANRRVEDAQKAYDDASENMLVDNRSNVIGTKGANAEYDAENNEEWARYYNSIANSYDRSAQNRGLFDRAGREADEFNRDQYRKEAQDYAKKANDLRVQAQKEYADDYRKLEEADRNLRAAEKARDENTLGGVVGNAAKDAGNWLGNAFNDAKNWVGDRAQDVGKAATNAYNDASKAVGNAANDVGNFVNDNYNRAREAVNGVAGDVGNAATSAFNDAKNWAGDAVNWVGDRAKDVRNLVSNQDERQKMQDIIDKHYDPETNTFDSKENFEKFDNARTAYLNHPMTAVSEAGNWIGDRARDVGNAASNIWDDVSATARGVADSIGNKLTGNIDRNTAESLRRTADFQEDPNAPYHSPMEQYSPENLRRQADEYQQRADNSLFSRIGNAAKDVGDWASNAASDVTNWGAGAIDKGKTAVSNFFSELVNPHYNLNANDMKSRYEEILAELPKGDIARIRYYGNSQGDQDALREQAIESIKRGR